MSEELNAAAVVDSAEVGAGEGKKKRTRKGGPRGPRKNKRNQLVVPSDGFAAPITEWNGEALPNRQKFAADDRDFNYLTSKKAWMLKEVERIDAELAPLASMTKEQRVAKAAALRGEAKFEAEFGARVEAAKTDANVKAAMLSKLVAILSPEAFAGMIAGESAEVQAAVLPLVGAELQSAIAAALAR